MNETSLTTESRRVESDQTQSIGHVHEQHEPLDAAAKAQIEREFIAELTAKKRRSLRHQILLNTIGILLFLALWELLPRVVPNVNQLMFPPPSGIVEALRELVQSGELLTHIVASLRRAALGFVLGSILGVLTGLLTGRIRVLRELSDPVLHSLRSIPAIAFVPLAIVWFGLGELPKIVLITWGAFFPVWINSFTGVREVPSVLIRSAASLGANQKQILFQVVLPAALPFVFAGLRQATAISLVVLVAAELTGASEGLGFLIATSHLLFRVDIMFVGLMALGALGFLADRLFLVVLHRLFPWYGSRS